MIKKCQLVLWGAILLLFSSGICTATDGYVFRNGYYYYANEPTAYYRSWETIGGYWSYGVYYAPVSRWVYYATTVTPQYVTPTTTYKDPGWRGKLLELADAKLKYEGKLQQEALEQRAYMESINALGLNGLFRYGNGTVPPYLLSNPSMPYVEATYNSTQTLFGAQGSTQFGYQNSYNAAAAQQNDPVQMSLQLWQMANQQAMASIEGGSKATQNFSALLSEDGKFKARVAEINAKVSGTIAVMNALSGPPSVTTQGFSVRVSPKGFGVEIDSKGVNPSVKEGLVKDFVEMVAGVDNKSGLCAGCHNPTTKKGGFDMTTWFSLSQEAKNGIILDRIVTKDDSKRMPRKLDGSAGIPCTPNQVRLFQLN